MTAKKQYVVVNAKNFRRHSAPDTGVVINSHQNFRNLHTLGNLSRASVCDFSVLLEGQSDSDNSLEFDTSTLSTDFTQVQTKKISPGDSYQNLPELDFNCHVGSTKGFSVWTSFGNG